MVVNASPAQASLAAPNLRAVPPAEPVSARGTATDGIDERRLTPADPWAECRTVYERALAGGDFFEAERIAVDVLARGSGLACLYQRLMAPALRRIGDLWELGEISVADEHLATEATRRAMAAAAARVRRRSSSAASRCLLMATPSGERHGLGLRMASDVLEMAGHETVHIGVDAPVDDIARMVRRVRPDAVGLSFVTADAGAEIESIAKAIWNVAPGIPLLVGGGGVPSRLPTGPISRIDNLETLAVMVEELPDRSPELDRVVVPRDPFARSWDVQPAAVAGDPGAWPVNGRPSEVAVADMNAPRERWRQEVTVIVDASHRVLEWSEGAAALFGWERTRALGSDLRELIVPTSNCDDYEEVLRGPAATASTPAGLECHDLELVRRGGARLDVRVRASMIPVEPAAYVLTMRVPDADAARELETRQLRSLFEASGEAVATLDLDGTVTGWNSAAAELYGPSAEEAVGRRIGTLIATISETQEFRRWLREVRAGGSVEARDDSRLHADGSPRPMTAQLLPIRDEGRRTIGAVLIVRDA